MNFGRGVPSRDYECLSIRRIESCTIPKVATSNSRRNLQQQQTRIIDMRFPPWLSSGAGEKDGVDWTSLYSLPWFKWESSTNV